MRIEVLFPEFGNYFGDSGNIRYLQACAPEAEFIITDNRSVPCFANEDVDMIYIGSMSERKQEIAVKRLLPYKERLQQLIEKGVIILATGNAMELFGECINDGGETISMLGMFPFHTDRYIQEIRHNSMFIGNYNDIKIVGYKSQFSYCRGNFENPFIQVIGGCGNNPDDKTEGINYKNFFATYLLGPLLVLNPLFAKHLLKLMGHSGELAFEKEAMAAYNERVECLEDEGTVFWMDENS
ncbi:MAG: hypothetical protein E7544_02755 [Ruminococcaceae bacterium]|nr:hypothetical protein [Oscillospiraceae bacterium]